MSAMRHRSGCRHTDGWPTRWCYASGRRLGRGHYRYWRGPNGLGQIALGRTCVTAVTFRPVPPAPALPWRFRPAWYCCRTSMTGTSSSTIGTWRCQRPKTIALPREWPVRDSPCPVPIRNHFSRKWPDPGRGYLILTAPAGILLGTATRARGAFRRLYGELAWIKCARLSGLRRAVALTWIRNTSSNLTCLAYFVAALPFALAMPWHFG